MAGIGSISQYVFSILLSAAVLHGLFLVLLLVLRSPKQLSTYLLGACIFFISTMAAALLLFISGLILNYPHLLGVYFPGFYLIGIFFYFYIQASIQPTFKWKYSDSLHFLPFILCVYVLIPTYSQDVNLKLETIRAFYYTSDQALSNYASLLFYNGPVLHMLCYSVVVFFQLQKKEKSFSYKENLKRIKWLKKFVLCFFLLLLSDLIMQFLFSYFNWNPRQMDLSLTLAITIYIHLLGYLTLGKLDKLPKLKFNNSKYRTSPLTKTLITHHKKILLALLEKEKPFLNPTLKVSELAQNVELPSHQLSQVLTEGLNTNFYDLINYYRIEEIKKRLVHPKYRHYSILAIALDCGFNNKTTFNRVFKKYTGKTPSDFVRQKNHAK